MSVILVLLVSAMASDYTRTSIAIDFDRAMKSGLNDVYLFDSTDYFVNATLSPKSNTYFYVKNGKYLIRNDALKVFNKNINIYYQFTREENKQFLTNDTIGVRLVPKRQMYLSQNSL